MSATSQNPPKDDLELLARSSPALLGSLKRSLSGEESTRVASAYRGAIERGAAIERGFIREAGASFNPRPARVLQLLIQEVHAGEEVLTEALDALVSGHTPERRLCTRHEVHLAIALDDLRHLHLRSADDPERAQLLQTAQTLLSHAAGTPSCRRLCELLQHALLRQEQLQRENVR